MDNYGAKFDSYERNQYLSTDLDIIQKNIRE